MKFRIILTRAGKFIFKGGNIEVMQKPLIEFEAKTNKEAKNKFYNIICSSVGSASLWNYDLEEVKK